MATDADLIPLLQQIDRKLDVLLSQRGKVASADDTVLAECLLPALAGAFGGEVFSASDAVESPAVRAGVGDALSVIAAGRLLARLSYCVHGGYRLERAGQQNGAALWRVVCATYQMFAVGADESCAER